MSLAVAYNTYENDDAYSESSVETIDVAAGYSNNENLTFNLKNVKVVEDDSFLNVSLDSGDNSDSEEQNSNDYLNKTIDFNVSKPNYKKFCIFLAIGSLFWLVMLAVAVFLYVTYHKKCKFYNSFELFGICLLVYVNVRYVFDLTLGLVTYCKRCKKERQRAENREELLPGSEALTAENPELTRRVTDGQCLCKTVDMSKKIESYTSNDVCIRCILRQEPSSVNDFTQEQLLSALANVGNIRKKWSLNEQKRTALHNLHNLKLGLETVPLLSVVFYFVIVINASHSNYVYDTHSSSEDDGCHNVIAFNWVLLSVFIIHGLFKLLPILVCIFYNTKPLLT